MISDYLKFDELVTITDLQKLSGFTNRKVRKMIEQERQIQKDFVIISTSRSKGYYKTKDRQKILSYLTEQTHRARKIFFNLRGANLFLANEGQMRITDETE